jgi:8-hydroxy-5-deazaflavin:NADPH oxidoreductase
MQATGADSGVPVAGVACAHRPTDISVMGKQKITLIGKGHVGAALSEGLRRAGHDVRMIGKGGGVKDAAAWADVVILAVPYGAIGDVAAELGAAASGKPVVDATNVLTKEMAMAVGFTTSGAEELQKKLAGAKVVKAFNTVFAQTMNTGTLKGQALFMPVAGDDAAARAAVIGLAKDIGFDAVDAGPLSNARLLEPLGYLNIQLGYVVNKGMGPGIGFALVR